MTGPLLDLLLGLDIKDDRYPGNPIPTITMTQTQTRDRAYPASQSRSETGTQSETRSPAPSLSGSQTPNSFGKRRSRRLRSKKLAELNQPSSTGPTMKDQKKRSECDQEQSQQTPRIVEEWFIGSTSDPRMEGNIMVIEKGVGGGWTIKDLRPAMLKQVES